jgi:predicted nucleic acid-binding protein
VAGELVLDTGALVSLLDRRQRRHRQFLEFFNGWDRPVVSTEAVLTEATHLMGHHAACLDFFLEGGAVLVPGDLATLRRCRDLMAKYHDLPMDYADATLIVLAEDLETTKVCTTDRDFSVYRAYGRSPFEILPA